MWGRAMKIVSVSPTYRIELLQVFFEDSTELILRVGYPVGQEHDLDVDTEWVTETAPKWAESLTPLELLKMAEEHHELD
jgi:hypothetical protein